MSSSPQPGSGRGASVKARLIVLGAGRPYRGVYPSAMVQTSNNRRTLDWTLDAFNQVMETDVYFVGGYRIEEIVQAFPDISFSVNPNWDSQGPLGSLLAAPLSQGKTTYICYSDIVISEDIVRSLQIVDSDVVIATDRAWQHRYEGRSTEDLATAEKIRIHDGHVTELSPLISLDKTDAEFVGIMKLSPRAVDCLAALQDRHRELAAHGMPRLVQEFQNAGLEIKPAESDGRWAELNAPQDLARFVLGTKADTLERLRPLVTKSLIGEQINFTVSEWRVDKRGVMDRIREKFGAQDLAIRSSSMAEDTWANSNAGSFTSLLDVPGSDAVRLEASVDQVAASYSQGIGDDQVLVQSMVKGVVRHGVVLTRTLNHGAPYYTLNFDDSASGGTESVTSGHGHDLRTVVIHRSATEGVLARDPGISPILQAVIEIEEQVGHDAVDVEFAITRDDAVHVLQVRPITIDHGWDRVDDSLIEMALRKASETLEERQKPGPFILGGRTIFGIMPDWNPAEIIGPTPRRLALSLYQHLITDEVWATQRAEYGYRDVRPHPLMVSFGGHPYIDVRACFNSFIPASAPDQLAERLVSHYVETLAAQPHLHDKVEFEIAITCLDFDFGESSKRLLNDGFSEADVAVLRESLVQITQKAPGRCQGELDQIAKLDERFHLTMAADMAPLSRAFALIDDCKRYGTLPFAHLARAAFVANSLLRSLELSRVTDREQTERFMGSISTVSSSFESDGWRVADGALSWDDFQDRYGHLRPGTYEVTSQSYAENPERYMRSLVKDQPADYQDGRTEEIWNQETRLKVQTALDSVGLSLSVEEFDHFLRQAIEGREYSKFVFSRHLSAALDELVKFGQTAGLDREQLSHIGIDQFLAYHSGLRIDELGRTLAEQATEGMKWHSLAQAIDLSPLLIESSDIFAYERHPSQPNFVTTSRVVAKALDLADTPDMDPNLDGLIVLIPQADPGFDWLFGHSIAGLVTMYGGANSHMTIRAAEFGLPAAIGVGQALYDRLAEADMIELDCGANWVRKLR